MAGATVLSSLSVGAMVTLAKTVANPRLTECATPTVGDYTYYVSAYHATCRVAMQVFRDYRHNPRADTLMVGDQVWRYLTDEESIGDNGDDYIFGSGSSRVTINAVPTSGIESFRGGTADATARSINPRFNACNSIRETAVEAQRYYRSEVYDDIEASPLATSAGLITSWYHATYGCTSAGGIGRATISIVEWSGGDPRKPIRLGELWIKTWQRVVPPDYGGGFQLVVWVQRAYNWRVDQNGHGEQVTALQAQSGVGLEQGDYWPDAVPDDQG